MFFDKTAFYIMDLNISSNHTDTDDGENDNLPQITAGGISGVVIGSLTAFIFIPILIYYLLPGKYKHRIISFFKKGLLWNSLVLFFSVLMASLFIAGVTEKWTSGSNDSVVDYCKLFMVWANVIILMLILFQKRVFLGGALWIQVCYGAAVVALHVFVLLNLSILIISDPNEEVGNDKPLSIVPYNRDYLTFAATILTDLVYLSIYVLFQSSRAISCAILIITLEIIIIGWSTYNATDFAVDTANLALSFVSGSLAIIMWTAKVTFTSKGSPLDFKDFAIRDDLDESFDSFLIYDKRDIVNYDLEVAASS